MADAESQQKKQIYYRDARFKKQYDAIWQSVGKCVFCDLKDDYVFFEENGIVLTISLFAYIDGHCMIIPRRHVRSAKDLTQTEWETVRKLFYVAKRIIREVHGIKGLQYVLRDGGIVAQSTVSDHLHIHCVPFDAPDLNVWNYRELKYTPLENVALYKKARKRLITSVIKFNQKYEYRSEFPVICDAFIINTDGEVLLQERTEGTKLKPDFWTPPGGMVDDFGVDFEQELAREVKEETGLNMRPTNFQLFYSRMGDVTRTQYAKALKVRYANQQQHVWNSYVVREVDKAKLKLVPGDDAKELIWVPLAEAATHPRVSAGSKAAVKRLMS